MLSCEKIGTVHGPNAVFGPAKKQKNTETSKNSPPLAATYLSIHPESPQPRFISRVVDCLRKGGIIIYPTDTLYGLGCDMYNKKAVERICQLKGISPEKAQLSCICPDLKTAGAYTIQLSNPVFKLMRKTLPGPYTYVLQASKEVPRHFQSKRKTIGIRVVDHAITNAIVQELGHPLLSTSLPPDEDEPSYIIYPEEIRERYHKRVDFIVDGGYGEMEGSTVLDCSGEEIVVLREGKGTLEGLGI